VVANPASGSTRLEDILNDVIDFLNDKKYKYEVFLTTKKHNAWKTVEKNLRLLTSSLLVGMVPSMRRSMDSNMTCP
jgi:diacylglycerol kinase family enzyme